MQHEQIKSLSLTIKKYIQKATVAKNTNNHKIIPSQNKIIPLKMSRNMHIYIFIIYMFFIYRKVYVYVKMF